MTVAADAELAAGGDPEAPAPGAPEPAPAEPAPDGPDLAEWEQEPPLPPLRVGLVVGCSTIAAAVMVGSVFEGQAGRVYGAIAGLCGVGVAAQAARRRSALWVNVTIVLGLSATGIVLLVPTGIDNVVRIPQLLSEAKAAADVLRPPAELLPGWRLILGWMMGVLGFTAGWLGIELRRPALGLLAPLPFVALGAISVPDEAKLPAGVAAVVLFVVGLALLSSTDDGDAASRPGLAFELRRAGRLLPVLAAVTVALVALSRTSFLFPDPVFDPTREAQRPKAVPLSEVEDRPLFEVRSDLTGPWRVGILDVYDGEWWRLPAFVENEQSPVPSDGFVDRELTPAVRADFTVADLGGAVLPGLPGTVGVVAEGPRLTYDPRTSTIRLAQGQVQAGLRYSVVGAALPSEDELRSLELDVPPDLARFVEMPAAPPAVRDLLAGAPTNAWDRLELVRRHLLETVVAAGPGTPVPVPPERVEDLLAGSREGSPYEIVAAQAMLARWAGIPARIGYGFDGGDELEPGRRQIRPEHGATWLEVWFPGHKWLPLIGSPLQARASLATDGPTRETPEVTPSDDIGVQIYVPLRRASEVALYRQIQRLVLLVGPALALGWVAWLSVPVLVKARRRSRRRVAAARQGPAAEVAQAYAELRDTCIDLGLGRELATPLRFLERLAPDEEHTELAWLTTRVLWGDLRHDVHAVHAADARELSRALRRRLLQAQPWSMRVVAAVSRRSLRAPYSPELEPGDWSRARTPAPPADRPAEPVPPPEPGRSAEPRREEVERATASSTSAP